MDVIIKIQNRLERKINYTLLALLPNKINTMQQGLVTSGEGIRNKRAIPTLAIIQGVAAIDRRNDDKRDKCISRCKGSIIV